MASPSILLDSGKFRLELEHNSTAGFLLIRLIGVIDEDVNFSTILEAIDSVKKNGSPLVIQFDLNHVARMNSCGVREWFLLMERMRAKGPCEFVNVPELFIEQTNVVPNLFGEGRNGIVSFKAPYYCPKCNTDITVLLKREQIPFDLGKPVPPPFKCPKCLGLLEFGWIPEEYFHFLTT